MSRPRTRAVTARQCPPAAGAPSSRRLAPLPLLARLGRDRGSSLRARLGARRPLLLHSLRARLLTGRPIRLHTLGSALGALHWWRLDTRPRRLYPAGAGASIRARGGSTRPGAGASIRARGGSTRPGRSERSGRGSTRGGAPRHVAGLRRLLNARRRGLLLARRGHARLGRRLLARVGRRLRSRSLDIGCRRRGCGRRGCRRGGHGRAGRGRRGGRHGWARASFVTRGAGGSPAASARPEEPEWSWRRGPGPSWRPGVRAGSEESPSRRAPEWPARGPARGGVHVRAGSAPGSPSGRGAASGVTTRGCADGAAAPGCDTDGGRPRLARGRRRDCRAAQRRGRLRRRGDDARRGRRRRRRGRRRQALRSSVGRTSRGARVATTGRVSTAAGGRDAVPLAGARLAATGLTSTSRTGASCARLAYCSRAAPGRAAAEAVGGARPPPRC